MCDDVTAAENEAHLADPSLTRRGFATIAGAAGLAMLLPAPANAAKIVGRDVVIDTPDGKADAYFVGLATGKAPGVLVWPDIMGLRPAFRQMADRLAQSGYAVLVVNQFYRSVKSPIVAPGEDFGQPAVRAKIMPYVQALSTDGTTRDALAFTAWLDAQHQVNRAKGLATTGYCMGGPMVMRTAAANPARVRAGATFHGGGLATDKPDSPHLLIPKMKAGYLIAIAANDDARDPAAKDTLRAAFAAAKLPAEIEVYAGTMHGWTPPDSKVYNAAQADKAWARMLALFATSL